MVCPRLAPIIWTLYDKFWGFGTASKKIFVKVGKSKTLHAIDKNIVK